MTSEPTIRVLSLGAGVQSSAVYLKAVRGEYPNPPTVAIFADTQWEPQEVYDWLDRLDAYGGETIPIHRVTAGSVRGDALQSKYGYRFATMPLYVAKPDGTREGMLRRQCTREYKVEPITKEIRRMLGLKKGQRVPKGTLVESWQGISLDEVTRMRDAKDKWVRNYYPLIDHDGWDRRQCITYLDTTGWANSAKSACIGCPYADDDRWRHLRDTDQGSWDDAVDFDRLLREGPKLRGVDHQGIYLHRSCVPLSEVDFETLEDKGQINMFENECEGMCGV